ncbi:sigma-54-dependent Fis family transcriptional regulator [Abyssisolibacter fermentans]|uniref:sigma-54-dependent Fis family transcriptional regulator n=1 Tax=Abyssisolibacter fermentans TaxID=1766203 RepID=UPI000832E589|nr:sigma-54-dependent Fis family transcriptional regulator [Abyssisolibacter fermentans]
MDKLAIGRGVTLKTWKEFIHKGNKDETIRDIIIDSWERSKTYRIDPYINEIQISLNSKDLSHRYQKMLPLIKRAKPFMESLNKLVGGPNLIIRFTDKDGYVLEWLGEPGFINKYGKLNFYKGCNIREDVIGTNAIGLALKIGKAVQVVGEEHFCKIYHNWTSSACPIKDDMNNIIGVLSLTGVKNNIYPHTLGMVIAASQAIENELKLENINKQLDLANKHFYAIMESISEGLICTDSKGVIQDINLFARRFLKLKEKDIVGKRIESILYKNDYLRIENLIEKGRRFEEEEIYFKTKSGKSNPCIVNITPIKFLASESLEGIVITFKNEKVVHKLVNKIVGAKARFTFDDIIGDSRTMKNTKNMAMMASASDTTVLLLGESGVGKEMFAQAIHNESNRKKKPFVVLNCGAIPRELVASELFGYVEGAFTGARRGGQHGKFERANEGTIFLDEIGDMPLDAQVSLLRVLEMRQITRVGGHEVVPVNVRVIAATHKDLKKEVERGNFRDDLFYRLNVMPIYIPSLRNRKEDITEVSDYFIYKFLDKMNKKIKGIDSSFYKALKQYSWPGNIRELQNVIQRAINMVKDNQYITSNDLPRYIFEDMDNKNTDNIAIYNDIYNLEAIEKNTIIEALKKCKGNMALTAKLLGIGRSTLYRKMDKYLLKGSISK